MLRQMTRRPYAASAPSPTAAMSSALLHVRKKRHSALTMLSVPLLLPKLNFVISFPSQPAGHTRICVIGFA